MADSVRLDKYLWSIRVFKTRSEATDACNGNKVRIGGVVAKPAKAVKTGDLIEIHKGPACLTYRVIDILERRVGAQLVPDYAENLTPESEIQKFRAPVETFFVTREKGSGRPTKKDRRTLDALYDNLDE